MVNHDCCDCQTWIYRQAVLLHVLHNSKPGAVSSNKLSVLGGLKVHINWGLRQAQLAVEQHEEPGALKDLLGIITVRGLRTLQVNFIYSVLVNTCKSNIYHHNSP